MSGKVNCWGNAVMESFYLTIKVELIYQRNYETRIEARRDIFETLKSFITEKDYIHLSVIAVRRNMRQ